MSQRIVVKGRAIGPDEQIFITAEIGASHMGDYQAARELVIGAKKAGCDGADMFLASPEDFNHCGAPDWIEAWREQSLTPEQWHDLFNLAEEIGIILYVTPLDIPSIKLGLKLGSPMFNINSDVVNDLRMLELIGEAGIPVSMHDIGITLSEIEAAIQTLKASGCSGIILLHSTREGKMDELGYSASNLRVMDTYRAAFSHKNVQVGCVEHTDSDFLIYGVAAREAVMISKHIITRHSEGAPDDSISVELRHLQEMVHNVRMVQSALGKGTNCILPSKAPGSEIASVRAKILVAGRNIPAGKMIDKDDVVAKRKWVPGGMHPWKMRELYGSQAKQNIANDEVLSINMFTNFVYADYKYPHIDIFENDSLRK
ncbi:MAG: hypothetical protein A2Y12_11835 [Planctomycetes bacterium GWF2_42_9]|nr:MAG: hypothetical protein A2Y12_11835 [Planctomycetes bacterium GWF2_42_9]